MPSTLEKLESPHGCRTPDPFYDVIKPGFLRIHHPPRLGTHNAIWDLHQAQDGRLYFGLCNEITSSATTVLTSLDPQSGSFQVHAAIDKLTMQPPGVIPASKIHSCMGSLRDGKLVILTHTTSPAPSHPHWLLEAYHNHLWEGFPGSALITYDPAARHAQLIGFPFPRESVYGAALDSERELLWCSLYLSGRLACINLRTLEIRDLGQVSEYGSFRVFLDAFGNAYVTSRSGVLFRASPEDFQVRAVGRFSAREESHPLRHECQMVAFAHPEEPRPTILLFLAFSDWAWRLDPCSTRLERIGRWADGLPDGWTPTHAMTPVLTPDGSLWFTTCCPINQLTGQAVHLWQWDYLANATPRCHGLLGTPDRVSCYVSEGLLCKQTGNLFFADTGHGDDPPVIYEFDWRAAAASATQASPGRRSRSPLTDPQLQLLPRADWFDLASAPTQGTSTLQSHRGLLDYAAEYSQFLSSEAGGSLTVAPQAICSIPLWHETGRGSTVIGLNWLSEDDVLLNTSAGWYSIHFSNGSVRSLAKPAQLGDGFLMLDSAQSPRKNELKDACLMNLRRPGRPHLCKPSVVTRIDQDDLLVGTQDATIGLIHSDNSVRNEGYLPCHGPVHDLVWSQQLQLAIGCCGHPSDLGLIFTWTRSGGLRVHGFLATEPTKDRPITRSLQPRRILLDPTQKLVLCLAADELTTVYRIDLQKLCSPNQG